MVDAVFLRPLPLVRHYVSFVKCDGEDSKAVGTIIGSKGKNIKKLQSSVGHGCFAVYKKLSGGFQVSCTSEYALTEAEDKILEGIKNYHAEQKKYTARVPYHSRRRTTTGDRTGVVEPSLISNPTVEDKIEEEIMFTCFSPPCKSSV